jgi:UDP-N-acetylglucosamine acyltransferase
MAHTPGHAAGSGDEEILSRVLPGRYPQRLVDRVRTLEPARRIVADKAITSGAPFFVGHFPDLPLMPGVLICEALLQAAALLVAGSPDADGTDVTVRVTGMDRARFRQPAVPGDRLELDVSVLARDAAAWRLRGVARAGAQVVAEADFRIAVVPAARIHPTAVVAAGAELAADVAVGPYAVIGPHVRIGSGTTVGPHAVIEGWTTLGRDNRIFQLASVGAPPQDLKYQGEASRLEIGDRNVIREFATLNPGTAGGGMVTRIGDDNLLMNYAHVGHDSQIGSHCVLANSTALAGHVTLEDWVIVGGLVAVHQFVRIGESALLGGGAMVVLDVPPFCIASGDRARLRGLNLVGLRRRGFDALRVRAIKQAYRILFGGPGTFAEGRARCAAELGAHPDVVRMLAFLEGSGRGVSSVGAREDDGG